MILRLLLAAMLFAGSARAESQQEREREEREREERRRPQDREGEAGEKRDGGATRPGDAEMLYAIGALLGSRLAGQGFSREDVARIGRGFADAAGNRKLKLKDPDLEEWGPRVDAYLLRRGNPRLTAEKDRGAKLIAAEAKEPGAEQIDDGIVFRTLRAGDGDSPRPTDRVRVKYESRTADGAVFDQAASVVVPINGVVRCWKVAMPRMKVGGKARVVCPSAMAYGDQGRPPHVPGGSAVVFEIELLALAK